MTVQERKNIVLRLGKQFLNEKNPVNLKFIRTEIINEVMAAKYNNENVDTIKLGMKEWGDLSKYIMAMEKNEVGDKLRFSAYLSLVGLATLIDLSEP